MSDKPNLSLSTLPLKAYDFFSIVFPGVSVLLSAYFFEDLYSASQSAGQSGSTASSYLPVHWLMNEIWRNSSNASSQAAVVAISMCMIYLSGQLVSSIANFFLDRIFVYKCYGYPYENLLFGNKKEAVFVDYFSRRFYRGSIFWLHAAAFFFVIYDIYNTHRVYLVLALACVSVFVVALLFRLVIQHYNKKNKTNKEAEQSFKSFVKKYAWGYRQLMNPIQHINQTAKPMQEQLAEKYKILFKQDFGIDPETAASDNYWFSLFYIRKNDPRMSELVHRWHQTAIFARNMAASFYMAFGYSIAILWYETSWKNHLIETPHTFRIAIALLGLFATAMFLVIRFYYFYVSYYSKCLFRAFVFLHFDKNVKSTIE